MMISIENIHRSPIGRILKCVYVCVRVVAGMFKDYDIPSLFIYKFQGLLIAYDV